MKREIPDSEREWVARELSSYSGTLVESIDCSGESSSGNCQNSK
jgi:hypothetical protein